MTSSLRRKVGSTPPGRGLRGLGFRVQGFMGGGGGLFDGWRVRRRPPPPSWFRVQDLGFNVWGLEFYGGRGRVGVGASTCSCSARFLRSALHAPLTPIQGRRAGRIL